ncbi:MAG: 2Fe-2S iron-sulfur cluster binding domain-containing protein [Gammaproteobacteria bacterium]|nr:2Fe-2S iron-sulfur cluster binding domain-containing protein [Gammaproteobacteria bacterium]
MENLLNLSRAAKLVGVSRGSLQQKIQDGEIQSFEGLIRLEDLAQAFPDADIEHSNEMDRYDRIIEEALIRARYGKMQQLLAPDIATMTARAATLNKELIRIKDKFRQHLDIIEQLKAKLTHPQENQLEAATAKELLNWLSQRLDEREQDDDQVPYLVDKDTYLKVMAAHVRMVPSGHDFFVEGQDSILEAALRNGLTLEYGCSSGNCGLCKARVLSGNVKQIKHSDYHLSESERLDNIILMCCNTPVSDITLEAPEASTSDDIPEQTIPLSIRKLDQIDGITVLQTRTPRTQRLRFMAGQTVEVSFNPELQSRLHIASCPCDDMNIQFHLPTIPGDPVSDYVQHEMSKSDKLQIKGPYGDFVIADETMSPLLFIAYDTGFAPIKGLIENALAQDTAQTITLYRVGEPNTAFYLRNICRSWNDALDVFHYHEITTEPDSSRYLDEIVSQHHRLEEYLVYLAGPYEWLAKAQDYFANLEQGPAEIKIEIMKY